MTRQPNHCNYSPLENDKGFTFVEVIVALVLLSTISLVVWSASFTGGRTLSKIFSGISGNIEILEIDSAIRSYAQRIIMPYWLASAKIESSNGTLAIPYLDGAKDTSLKLTFQNGTLTIDDSDKTVSFPDIQDAQMEVAPPTQGAAFALLLSLHLRGNQDVTIAAPLGGLPFPLVGQQ